MPLNDTAKKVHDSMVEQYGEEEGERIFYATANKEGRVPETWEKKADSLPRQLGRILSNIYTT